MSLIQVAISAYGSVALAAPNTIQFLRTIGALAVHNLDAVATLYCRADGIDPTVEGDGSFVVPPASKIIINSGDNENPELRIISNSVMPTKYSIQEAI